MTSATHASGSRTSGTRSSGSRTLLSRDERHAQLLRAAATAFARTGFRATSMEDVAAEAGVTKLIVYRHFDGKEELYRSVLDSVNGRLTEELARRMAGSPERGATLRGMLAVARDDPDGFRLLTTHAPREPQFADHVMEYHRQSVQAADGLVGRRFSDPVWREWGNRMVVDHLVVAVLRWLEVGDPERDDEFVRRAGDGLHVMLEAWRAG